MTTQHSVLETRLGYSFRRRELLQRALTHSSALPELRAGRGGAAASEASPELAQDNEQLEFLGDAVLDMLASEALLENFPGWTEGQLSKSRARLVNERALEIAARRIGLGEYLRLGRGEEKTGGREKRALLADAFEAIIAAVYLDSGLPAARQLLHRVLFQQALEERGERISESDWKSALQELLQSRGQPPVEYRLASSSGPDHQKLFEIEVWVNGKRMASAEGKSKKEAEQRAAQDALDRLQSGASLDQRS